MLAMMFEVRFIDAIRHIFPIFGIILGNGSSWVGKKNKISSKKIFGSIFKFETPYLRTFYTIASDNMYAGSYESMLDFNLV